ncbi:MAG: hypothetical protein NTW86_09805, partial [Candidatus Sumerlaeota bacterium]|nr:hypothetical protein [Candidatus Sumerlaeota bacterium]
MQVYVAAFLLAAAALAQEIALTRLLSVITWYHLAFFAIATAMLGMTAGATMVYLKPRWFSPAAVRASTARACLGYALSVPAALITLCILPVDMARSALSLVVLLLATVACAAPYFFSGMATSAILTRFQAPIGKLYASDLLGAAAGCLFALGGLEMLDAPSLILACGAVGALAAWRLLDDDSPARLWRQAPTLAATLALAAALNSSTPWAIRPLMVKGRLEAAGMYLLEKWNSFSRVTVFQGSMAPPDYWGPSPKAPHDRLIPLAHMTIDGEAGTELQGFKTLKDIDHLRYDVTSVAYRLRPHGGACVIGVGGGRDILTGILFGQERIVGLDVNPIFIRLLEGRFRDFAGIAGYPGVTLVVDEARSWLSRSTDRFAVLQMSLIDTFAATGAGAFSLTENSLYTVEGWKIFLKRLTDDGIFTVSRWYWPGQLGETGRIVALAMDTLIESGLSRPADHIALIAAESCATLLVSKRPFTAEEIQTLKSVCDELEFNPAILPGAPPQDEMLRRILAAQTLDQLRQAVAESPVNFAPTTDEDPYFFNMLRLDRLAPRNWYQRGALLGNLEATFTLLALILCLALA